MSLQIEVLEDPAAACAELLLEVAANQGQIVLAGGSTPQRAYERAAENGGAWLGASVWFGDERCVPPADERSNFRMVKETLLDRLDDARRPEVRRITGELGPSDAADTYERELRDAGPQRFDLVLLGLGPDGHTASLFPGAPELEERDRDVVGVPRAGLEPFVPRVTMTLPRLQRAARIAFLVAGAGKAEAVAAAFGPDARPDPQIPASLVPAGADRVTVLLDPAAAARL
jgi:6-phosphogluconolactonase